MRLGSNQGCLGVGAGVKVSFYEESLGLLGTVETKAPIVAGAAVKVCLSSDVEVQNGQVYASVDDDGTMKGGCKCVY